MTGQEYLHESSYLPSYYLVPLLRVLPSTIALKHIFTAFEGYEAHFDKPDYVAYTWMWGLTCHP
jgi:hypothetical protein